MVEPPRRNMAMVSLTPRPWRRSIPMKISVPSGRATNASEKIANEYSVAVSLSTNGKTIVGKTSTEASA
jgi:hypothetical protein